MIGLFDGLKIGAGAILGAALAYTPAYLQGKSAGRSEASLAALEKTVEAYNNRTRENNDVKALDPIELCIDLGGVPEDCRTKLRRMGEGDGPPIHSDVSRNQ